MEFKKIFIQNFMSVGEEPIEINFNDYLNDRIVTINGINKDVGTLSSNGSGKCVDKNTQIEIEYDLKKMINSIKFDPFDSGYPNLIELCKHSSMITVIKTNVGVIEKLFRHFPRLKNTIKVKSDNGFYNIEEAKKTYSGHYYIINNDNGEQLICSPFHILYKDGNKEKKVKDLKVGDKVMTLSGLSELKSIKYINENKDLYDLQVKSVHKYFTNNYLSHNSLIIEAITFCLFDKTIRGMSKEECINNSTKKKLLLELYVDDFKIIRKRKPNKFQIFQDSNRIFGEESEITESTMARTQDYLENEIGINYKTFINTCCFGQHNLVSFLTADASSRRIIVENLLKLSKFNKYERKSRDYALMIKNEISDFSKKYVDQNINIERKNIQLKQYLVQRDSYHDKTQKEIEQLNIELESLEKININDYFSQWKKHEESRENKIKIQYELGEISQEYNKMERFYDNEINNLKKIVLPILSEIKSIDSDLENIRKLKSGVRCKSCYQEVDPKNYPDLISKLNKNKEELTFSLEGSSQKINNTKSEKVKILKSLSTLKQRKEKEYKKLDLIKNPIKSKDFLLNIQNNKKSISKSTGEKEKELKTNPYIDIVSDLEEEVELLEDKIREIKTELAKREEIAPYYNFWIKGFGEKGIKSFVIEQIIPALNQQVNYWMQFFINNKIIVEFDKFLDIKISRENGEPFLYNQGSAGERKRIDLAISLAFAHIMRLRSGVEMNILFLDELAESIDIDGIEGLDRALTELAKDRIVFIITHRMNLLDRLARHKKITIIKEGGFSKILKSN